MKKYTVGEDLKQGNECVILDGVVQRICECKGDITWNKGEVIKCKDCHKPIESEWCECDRSKTRDYSCLVIYKPNGDKEYKCLTCHKPIKPKRELPEKFVDSELYVYKCMDNTMDMKLIDMNLNKVADKINEIITFLENKYE